MDTKTLLFLLPLASLTAQCAVHTILWHVSIVHLLVVCVYLGLCRYCRLHKLPLGDNKDYLEL